MSDDLRQTTRSLIAAVEAAVMGMTRKRTLILLFLILTPSVFLFSIDSLQSGQRYRHTGDALEDPVLGGIWESITFFEDGSYRLESETLLYEGMLEDRPAEDGLSLMDQYEGELFRLYTPGFGHTIIAAGKEPATLRVPRFELHSARDDGIVRDWIDLLPHLYMRDPYFGWMTYELEMIED